MHTGTDMVTRVTFSSACSWVVGRRLGISFAIMERLLRDIRYAFLSLRRTPGLTLTVLVTLALGIGATTAMFSVVHAVLFEPLPYTDSGQLVRLWEEHPGSQSPAGNRWLSLRTRLAWRDRSLTLEDAGAYGDIDQ